MKITNFQIDNFRGIRHARAEKLGSTIIIAGQNGSGKSCLFDAIRLLKSVYGGYQQNEWHHWMGEFAINMHSPNQDFSPIFNDSTKPLTITATFELHDEEKSFLSSKAEELLSEVIWRNDLPDAYAYGGFRMAAFATQFREHEPIVKQKVANMIPHFLSELNSSNITGHVTIPPGQRIIVNQSNVLSVIFTLYRPREVGIIDYHGAQRHYGREQVQNINITLDQNNQVRSQSALYNSASKYTNVKNEMAASYLKEILAEQAGVPRASQSTLTNTLKELFENFFPDKKFLGPVPRVDGSLTFPVRTENGSEHDLDDLSAGEKEILYGYLRIRNSAPRFSIIFIDEPELHLNPRLIRGLPQFYRKRLGIELDNQIWLVSHSDALLREAVGKEGFDVFHMQPCRGSSRADGTISPVQNQLKVLDIKSDVDLALTDLVGDLAAYQPDKKAVIFEGGGDTDFDKWMTATLFPIHSEKVNFLSGSNKTKVNALHEVLSRAYDKGQIKTQFFGIVDKDYDQGNVDEVLTRFIWPVYHIENFLLDEEIISQVMSAFEQRGLLPEEVAGQLNECARLTVPKVVRTQMTSYAGSGLKHTFDLRFDPAADDVSGAISAAIARSIDRARIAAEESLSLAALQLHESDLRKEIERSFGDGTWKSSLPGREILKAYVGKFGGGISYEKLRNLIVNRMSESSKQPAGMKSILDAIVAA